jgi:hypothetical protein
MEHDFTMPLFINYSTMQLCFNKSKHFGIVKCDFQTYNQKANNNIDHKETMQKIDIKLKISHQILTMTKSTMGKNHL